MSKTLTPDAKVKSPDPAPTTPGPSQSNPAPELLYAAAVANRDLNLTDEEFKAQGQGLLADLRGDMLWAVKYARENKGAGGITKAHSAWTQYKISQGWTFGPRYDLAEKKHPSLCVYSGCGARQQTLDGLLASLL